MSDNYQAVYDAVRSRVHWPDVENILRNAFDISWPLDAVKTEFINAAYEMQRPCVIFKPELYPDGDMWCALYGADIVTGVAGFGKTPSDAMYDFDKNWREQKSPMATPDQSAGGVVKGEGGV